MYIPPPGSSAPTLDSGVNWAHWIDKHFLPVADRGDRGWRNEGILTTLPSIVSTLIGIFAGLILTSRSNVLPSAKAKGLLAWGGLLTIAGAARSTAFPINKHLWTSSFVLFTGGLSMLLLALFFFIFDMCRMKRLAMPFIWIGANSIAAYLLAGILPRAELALNQVFNIPTDPTSETGLLILCAANVLLIVSVMCILYQRRIFLRV